MIPVTKHLFPFRNILVAIFVCLLFGTWACEKPQSYPPEPEISLKSCEVLDSVDQLGNPGRIVVMKFDFVDGDGDLSSPGKRPIAVINGDSIDTTTYSRIFLKLYEKKNGVYEVVPDSLLKTPTAFDLPYGEKMAREGQNKTQKGEIQFNYFYYNLFGSSLPDTIRIDFYIKDFSYNRSNTLEVSGIPLKKDAK